MILTLGGDGVPVLRSVRVPWQVPGPVVRERVAAQRSGASACVTWRNGVGASVAGEDPWLVREKWRLKPDFWGVGLSRACPVDVVGAHNRVTWPDLRFRRFRSLI
jgi:hypothetical protein